MDVTPFRIYIPDAVLEDLRDRLARTRWPDEIPGSDWTYGSNLAYVKELVEYWRTEFDWRKQEEYLNSFDHFRTTVDDLGIHFIHAKGKEPNPLPLVITHGWPSTFFEMLKVIPRLTDPAAYGGDAADSFDVVAPSMPGYGFSDAAQVSGMSPARVADYWAKLMTENLGYSRFVAQGGDWGAGVTARLGFGYPNEVAGIHVTAVSGAAMTPNLGEGDASPVGAGKGVNRGAGPVAGGRGRLLPHPGHQAANPFLRPERLAHGPGGVGRGEVPHLERLWGRRGIAVHQGRTADQHNAVLGHQFHRLVGTALL